MNTQEAAKKWKCSVRTVRNYCNSGIIPLAEKINNKWDIPDEMEKPPAVTAKRAVYLMLCVEDNIVLDMRGIWDDNKFLDALTYLDDIGYILNFKGHNSLEEAVRESTISKLGYVFMKKNTEKTSKNTLGVEGELGIKSRVLTATGKINYKHEG